MHGKSVDKKQRQKKWATENPQKVRAACAKWRAANPDKRRAYQRQWAINNPYRLQEARKRYRVRAKFLLPKNRLKEWRYRMQEGEWEQLFDAQGRSCKICGATETKHPWNTDHDHKTGMVRGILCRRCNHLLGAAGDNREILLKAIIYLDSAIQTGPQEDKS